MYKRVIAVLALFCLLSLTSCHRPNYPKEGRWHCDEIGVCFDADDGYNGLLRLETGEIVEITVLYDWGDGMSIDSRDSLQWFYNGRYSFNKKKLTYRLRETEDLVYPNHDTGDRVVFYPCDGNCDLTK